VHSYILEYNERDEMTTIKHCEKCKSVPLHKTDGAESWSYYIGDHFIEVQAHIPKGECPRCGEKWESEHAKQYRDEAFLKAIDNFWKEHMAVLNINDEEMASVMFVVSKLMMRAGQNKTRQVAAELGRWLAGCAFLY
jgi:hypothetical protein